MSSGKLSGKASSTIPYIQVSARQCLLPGAGTTGKVTIQALLDETEIMAVTQTDATYLSKSIRRIEAETGALLTLDPQPQRGSSARILAVTGVPRAVAAALHFIAVVAGLRNAESAPLRVRLRVDPREIGSVIGKRGARIKVLRDMSNAKLDIDPRGILSVAGGSPSIAGALIMVIIGLFEQRQRFGTPNQPTVGAYAGQSARGHANIEKAGSVSKDPVPSAPQSQSDTDLPAARTGQDAKKDTAPGGDPLP